MKNYCQNSFVDLSVDWRAGASLHQRTIPPASHGESHMYYIVMGMMNVVPEKERNRWEATKKIKCSLLGQMRIMEHNFAHIAHVLHVSECSVCACPAKLSLSPIVQHRRTHNTDTFNKCLLAAAAAIVSNKCWRFSTLFFSFFSYAFRSSSLRLSRVCPPMALPSRVPGVVMFFFFSFILPSAEAPPHAARLRKAYLYHFLSHGLWTYVLGPPIRIILDLELNIIWRRSAFVIVQGAETKSRTHARMHESLSAKMRKIHARRDRDWIILSVNPAVVERVKRADSANKWVVGSVTIIMSHLLVNAKDLIYANDRINEPSPHRSHSHFSFFSFSLNWRWVHRIKDVHRLWPRLPLFNAYYSYACFNIHRHPLCAYVNVWIVNAHAFSHFFFFYFCSPGEWRVFSFWSFSVSSPFVSIQCSRQLYGIAVVAGSGGRDVYVLRMNPFSDAVNLCAFFSFCFRPNYFSRRCAMCRCHGFACQHVLLANARRKQLIHMFELTSRWKHKLLLAHSSGGSSRSGGE